VGEDKMVTASGKVLIFIVFLVFFGGFSYGNISNYLEDKSLLENPKEIEAKITNTQIATKIKKGVEINTYNFDYSFEYDNKTHAGKFSTNEESGGVTEKQGKVAILFNPDHPEFSKLKSSVHTDVSISALCIKLIKSFFITAVMALILGYVLALKLGLVEKKAVAASENPA